MLLAILTFWGYCVPTKGKKRSWESVSAENNRFCDLGTRTSRPFSVLCRTEHHKGRFHPQEAAGSARSHDQKFARDTEETTMKPVILKLCVCVRVHTRVGNLSKGIIGEEDLV